MPNPTFYGLVPAEGLPPGEWMPHPLAAATACPLLGVDPTRYKHLYPFAAMFVGAAARGVAFLREADARGGDSLL